MLVHVRNSFLVLFLSIAMAVPSQSYAWGYFGSHGPIRTTIRAAARTVGFAGRVGFFAARGTLRIVGRTAFRVGRGVFRTARFINQVRPVRRAAFVSARFGFRVGRALLF